MQIRFLRNFDALVTTEPGPYESWEEQSFARGSVVEVLTVTVHAPPRNDMCRVEFPDNTVAMLGTDDFEVVKHGLCSH